MMLTTLLLLIGLHFVCDYPLQSDPIAVGKGRFAEPHLGVPWYYWLTAHAATHAVAVGLVLGPAFGLAEFAAHFLIDYSKCRKWTNIHVDQALHVVCKVAYIAAISMGAA